MIYELENFESSEDEEDNDLDIEFSEDDEESDIDDELIINIEDTDDEEDDDDEDNINFPGFETIFDMFRQDTLINTLSFLEKQIIFNTILNGIIDEHTFSIIKEYILKERALSHPSIDIFNIKKTIHKDKIIDSRTIKSTLYGHVINHEVVTPQEQQEIDILYFEQGNYKKIFKNLGNQDCDLLKLPEDILEKILVFSTPDHDLNIIEFFNIRLTSRKIHRIMYSKIFCKKLLSKFNVYDSFKNKFKNIKSVSPRIFNNISYEYIFNIFKSFMQRILGLQLIKAVGGFIEYFKLPYIPYCIKSECLDNLCGSQCGYRYHYLFELVDAPVSRGIDSDGRFYILFFYKTSTEYFYEFVYNNELPSNINNTFSGFGLNTFIGNMSINYHNTESAMYRQLKARSYDYIERLIKGEQCGEVYYNSGLEFANENKNKEVKLYFNRKVIRNYLIKKYDLYARPHLYRVLNIDEFDSDSSNGEYEGNENNAFLPTIPEENIKDI